MSNTAQEETIEVLKTAGTLSFTPKVYEQLIPKDYTGDTVMHINVGADEMKTSLHALNFMNTTNDFVAHEIFRQIAVSKGMTNASNVDQETFQAVMTEWVTPFRTWNLTCQIQNEQGETNKVELSFTAPSGVAAIVGLVESSTSEILTVAVAEKLLDEKNKATLTDNN